MGGARPGGGSFRKCRGSFLCSTRILAATPSVFSKPSAGLWPSSSSSPKGRIIAANENFCRILGYQCAEIEGKHHSLFVDPDYAKSPDYREFWAKLGRGEFDAREYRWIGKGGKEIWLQASYNPVLSKSGTVLKVVKVATDITAAKLQAAENRAKIDAISRAQVIVEYSPDGKVIEVNENFVKKAGYPREKALGMHHRVFVEPAYARSADYPGILAETESRRTHR